MDNKEYLVQLLKLAQSGDRVAENSLLEHIRDEYMPRRIGRYLYKNRQVEAEDLKQEFLLGVALSIHKAKMDIGDPIEYIIAQGIYRVRGYLRKHIMVNTEQVCKDCGHKSRLNRTGNEYTCHKCGGHNIETREICEHNEIAIMNITDNSDEIEMLIDNMSDKDYIQKFRETLDKDTRVYDLLVALYDEDINSFNPNIVNYMSEIAKRWGTSQTLVVQTKDKLMKRLISFCNANNVTVMHGHFIQVK